MYFLCVQNIVLRKKEREVGRGGVKKWSVKEEDILIKLSKQI